jgi:hypothetical protein
LPIHDNHEWLIERRGHQTPVARRAAFTARFDDGDGGVITINSASNEPRAVDDGMTRRVEEANTGTTALDKSR